MKRLLLTAIVLVMGVAWTLPVNAQTKRRVTAKIDDQGMATFGRFDIPVGSVASDFKAEMQALGPTTGFNSRPSLAITSAGGYQVFFTRMPTNDGLSNDAPLPLNQLVLQAGTYEIRPGGGRHSNVAVEFTVAALVFKPGPGEITALLDADCIQHEAILTVPIGMRAVNLRIWTDASRLPCDPGTLAPPMEASIEGPSFAYRWSKDGGTSAEWPAPIGTFELMPGIYTLRTGQGKLSRTRLSYELVALADLGDTVTIDLPPTLWEPVTEGTGSAWIDGNNLRIDSAGPGSAWFRTPRPYDFDRDYTVELEFRVNVSNGHWTWLYSDGFIIINTDWGLDLNHHQPGLPWSTKVIARLTEDRWHRLRIEASPENRRFRVYLDDGLAGTAMEIEPQMNHVPGNGFGNTDPDVIYFGDADSLAVRGGRYNHGNITVRAIRVRGASPATPGMQTSTPVPAPGEFSGAWNTDYGIMALTHTGDQVSGEYDFRNGKISGKVSSRVLSGTWSQDPSHSPPNEAGDIEFTLSEDGDSFTGRWRYGSSGAWRTGWSGTRYK